MRKLLMVFGFMTLMGSVSGEEKLGPDGFPADWTAEDFQVGEGVVASPSKTTVNQPKTFRIEELQKVRLAPSGTVPVALPPVRNQEKNLEISGTSFRPLGVVYGRGEEGNVGLLPIGVSGTEKKASESSVLADVAGFGVLVTGEGGLGKDVWNTSGYAKSWEKTALRFGTEGNGRHGVPKVNDLALREGWRRLLLSEAVPPAGVSASWLAVRAGMLERLGMHEAAWSLWRVAPPALREKDEGVAEGWVGSRLLAGDSKDACAAAKSRVAARGDGWWALAVAACSAVEATQGGNANALGLSLQLVPGDQARTHGPLMASLEAVRDGSVVSTTQVRGAWDSLAGAVVAAYPSVISASEVGVLPDVTLRRLRDSTALPEALRIQAGRALAARTGWVVDGAALVQLVSGGVIADSTPDAAVLAWAAKGVTGTGKQMSDNARLVVKAALRLGDKGMAEAWWPRWRGTEGLPPEQQRERLQAQVGLEALQGKVADETLARWVAGQEVGTTAGALQAQRVLLAVEGLQGVLDDGVWEAYRSRAVKVGDGADAVWQKVLVKAAAAGDVPQVLALVSEGFAGRTAADVPPGVAGASVAALVKVGLTDVAARMVGEIVTREDKEPGTGHQEPGDARQEVRVGKEEVGGAISATVAPVKPVVEPVEMLPPPRAIKAGGQGAARKGTVKK